MSGALNSVFGGGNIFGSLLSLASLAFPPLALAGSMSNLLTQAIGQAVTMAVDRLVQEAGMPRFLADIVKGVVGNVVGGQQQATDPAADAFAGSKLGGAMTDFTKLLADSLYEETKQQVQGGGRRQGGSTRASSGSWLEALARALGEVAGEKAAKMVELSNKLTDLSGSDSEEDAKEMTAVSQEMSGVSKIFQLLQDAANTVIKGIGDGLNTAARKT